MKKLLKVSVLLATVIALSACSNSANTTSTPPEEVYVPALPTIISDSEATSLSVTPELSDFTNGSWTLQTYTTYTNPNNTNWSWSKSYYESVKKSLSEEEKKELDSWIFTPSWQDEYTVNFHFPFDKDLWSKTMYFNKLKDDPTADNALKLNKIVFADRLKTSNALFYKLLKADNSYTWEDDCATTTYWYENDDIQEWLINSQFMPVMRDITNHDWKTNSEKTKFYAESGNTKFYLIKNN